MRPTSRRRVPPAASSSGTPSPEVACQAIRGDAERRACATRGGLPPFTIAERVSLRVEDVARVTGLSTSLVRGLIRDGELPAVKVRTVPLVLVADLLRFLEQRRSDPPADAAKFVAELEMSLRREER